MSAAHPQAADADSLVRAAALLGCSETATRAALSRLKTSGHLAHHARGVYRLGQRAQPQRAQLELFQPGGDQLLSCWSGAWIAVHTSPLSAAPRQLQRQSVRALYWLGFRAFAQQMHLRPDNLKGGVEGLRALLIARGADERLFLGRLSDLGVAESAQLVALWDTQALQRAYRKRIAELQAARRQLAKRSAEAAASAAFPLGRAAIRDVVLDPLLPDPLVDAALRQAFFDEARRFVRFGRSVWRQVLSDRAVTLLSEDEDDTLDARV